MTLTDIRLWTVDEYHQMLDAAILTHEDRVELLEGQIIQMSPQHPPHAATTQRASDYLKNLLGDNVTVRIQLPITLPPKSEPEPDIAVVRIDSRDYFEGHPTAADIFLLVEIADTTLKRDCNQKAFAYAKAKIFDYWVLDVNTQQVHVFRQPIGKKYQQKTILTREVTLSLLAFPEIEVQVARLFP